MKVPELTHIYAVIRDFKRPKLIKVTEYFVEQYLLIVQLNTKHVMFSYMI